jgi:hypothetical protein
MQSLAILTSSELDANDGLHLFLIAIAILAYTLFMATYWDEL